MSDRVRPAVLPCVLLVCLTLSGCQQSVDLSSVSAMAKTASAANDALLAIPHDFYDSCVREVGWSRGSILSSTGATSTVDQLQAAVPSDDLSKTVGAALKTLPGNTKISDLLQPSPYCDANKQASEQMIAVTQVLAAYFAAVGKLADTGSTADLGIDKLGTAVQGLDPKAKFNTSGKTAAIAGSLNALATALFASKARSDLAGDMTAANDLVAKIIDRLINDKDPTDPTQTDNVLGYYLVQLSHERFAMQTFYQNNIGQVGSGLPRLQAFQFYAMEQSDSAAIDQRIAGTEAYRAALQTLEKDHAQIAAAIKQDDLAGALSIANAYIREFQPQIDSIRKAFK